MIYAKLNKKIHPISNKYLGNVSACQYMGKTERIKEMARSCKEISLFSGMSYWMHCSFLCRKTIVDVWVLAWSTCVRNRSSERLISVEAHLLNIRNLNQETLRTDGSDLGPMLPKQTHSRANCSCYKHKISSGCSTPAVVAHWHFCTQIFSSWVGLVSRA